MRNVLISLVLLVVVNGILCFCPRLESNQNIHTLCTVREGTKRRETNCTIENESNRNKTRIPTGTIAEFRCAKFFKPVNKEQDGGELICTDGGVWSNKRAFQNFYCETDCGKRPALKNKLVSGGNSTESRHCPWVATIFRQTKGGKFKYSCGGTLIGQQAILTAAHCVSDEKINTLPINVFKIFLATLSSIFEENLKEGAKVFSVKTINVHPDYVGDTLFADIAVILLSEAVPLDDAVHPICFPRNYEQDTLVIGVESIGEMEVDCQLRYCSTRTSQSSTSCSNVIGIIPEGDQFCAGDPNGPSICRGDSGSGLVFKSDQWNENVYSIHGIVSNTGELANGCAPMVVLTKVFSHISWIQSILGRGYLYNDGSSRPQKQRNIKQAVGKYKRKERESLRKLRPLVQDILLEDYMHRDEYLIRFLRLKGFNLKQAEEALRVTMEWWKVNRINEILKEDFTEIKKIMPIIFQGFDKDGRPVFIAWYGGWRKKSVRNIVELEYCLRYLIRNSEEIERRIRTIGFANVTQATLITDFNGVAVEHLCPLCLRLLSSFVRISETHYPDQTHIVFNINAPAMVDRLFDAILPNLSEHWRTNTRIFGTNKTEWSQELLKHISADQLFVAYGGTKSIKRGTKRLELAL